jgi:hypothetical protein
MILPVEMVRLPSVWRYFSVIIMSHYRGKIIFAKMMDLIITRQICQPFPKFIEVWHIFIFLYSKAIYFQPDIALYFDVFQIGVNNQKKTNVLCLALAPKRHSGNEWSKQNHFYPMLFRRWLKNTAKKES